MRVLLSGASGFIGGALQKHLETAGDTVHRLVRKEPREGDALYLPSERRIDASRLPGGTIEGLDGVVHLAGEPITPMRWSPAKRERIRAGRVASTDVLARALARCETPPSVFVCASAIGFYGERGDELLDENSSGGDGFLADVCRTWETATGPAREAGIRVVCARSGIVIGKGGGPLRAQLPLFRFGLGGRLGTGRQWTSFIALEDEVGALSYLLATESLRGPVNLTAPQPVRNRDYTVALGHALRRPTIVTVPRTALRLVMGKAVANDVVSASQRVMPRQLQSSGFIFARPTIEDAFAAALGTRPLPAERDRTGSDRASPLH